jgi:hypothetical protein
MPVEGIKMDKPALVPVRLERLQLRMTPEVRKRLDVLSSMSSLTPHTLGSIALAVGLNVIEQSMMARVEGVEIEDVALALGLGVTEDLNQLERLIDASPTEPE